ncbi:thioredoxin [Candidatus Uhrbacteria bacterium]|nr:thioredoxin [Candidatus Uhrbacteria bacterium]
MAHIFNEANFQAEVLSSSSPVLVDFWAEWCGPCRVMGPIVEEIASETDESKLKVGKLNVDENMHLSTEYRILSIPTMLVFKDGKPVDTIVGSMSKQDLLAKLAPYLA